MHKIAVLPGDGVGLEIIPEALKVLNVVADKYGLEFSYQESLIGGAAIDATGHPLPPETLDLCRDAEAILLGAVGGPKWDTLPVELRPERAALLRLRKELNLFANLRPVKLYPELEDATVFKKSVVSGVDLIVVREATGGLYFGEKIREQTESGGERAVDTLVYTSEEVERIARLAFDMARDRRRKVTSVDKHNVLESSRMWRDTVIRVAADYPEITLEHIYVDNCAMQLVKNPRQFDVMVTENMFGDILSDQASVLAGSIGMLPSASLGGSVSLYEPAHGSAPDIAGQGKVNPLAAIMSAALMLRYSFDCREAANAVDNAISRVLALGYRTPDIYAEGTQLVKTTEMGDLVCSQIAEGS